MIPPRALPLYLTLALFVAAPAIAQERTASNPTNAASDISNDTLLRKVSHQTQVINTLQAQLKACQNDESYTPGLPTDTSGFDASGSRTPEAPASTTSTRFTSPQAAPPPPRRTVGVYQQPAEPKLTCADYSLSYFSRHPAMAAVCGVSLAPPQPVAQPHTDETTSDTDDATDVSASAVSPTIRLPQQP
ncbi:MAG: hypothetical protein EON60_04935 [Alphaproteobacteria bacterium]|nr:MAG: hypothetical protein EON60_04935 [Alphaproteobacteria bacterium]